MAIAVATADGKVIQGYKEDETDEETGAARRRDGQADRDRQGRHRGGRELGTLMPEGWPRR